MRILILFVAFFVLPVAHISAQETATFSEDFSGSAESLWMLENTDLAVSEFKDGKYYMESKTKDGYYVHIPTVMVGDKKTFEATFTVKWLSGTSNEWGYGLTWGKGVDDKVTVLVFSGNLNYMLYQFSKKYKILEDPSYSPQLLPGKTNVIRVNYDGKKIAVFVNDQQLFSGKAKQWGGSFSFVLFEKQKVVIDDLKIVYGK